jgi:hypothetical protein
MSHFSEEMVAFGAQCAEAYVCSGEQESRADGKVVVRAVTQGRPTPPL